MYLSEVRWTKTVVSTFVEAGASHEPLDYSSGAFRCNVRGRDTEANPNPNPNPTLSWPLSMGRSRSTVHATVHATVGDGIEWDVR